MEPKKYLSDNFSRITQIYRVAHYNVACCYSVVNQARPSLNATAGCHITSRWKNKECCSGGVAVHLARVSGAFLSSRQQADMRAYACQSMPEPAHLSVVAGSCCFCRRVRPEGAQACGAKS